jgi:chromosome segregation ATPase
MSNTSFDPNKHAAQAPKWALGMAFVLSAIVGAILAATPIIDIVIGRQTLQSKNSACESRIEGMQRIVDSVVEKQSYITEELKAKDLELAAAMEEISDLRSQIHVEVKIRERLTRELLDKEIRIKELETIIAKLTDSKFNSIK